MTSTFRITLHVIALFITLPLCVFTYPAAAQPSPQLNAEHWDSLSEVKFGRDVRAIYVDRDGLMEVENFNSQDERAYPAVRVLVDLAEVKNAGILGAYRSIIYLVALDCPGKRAQNIQVRFYAQNAGVERTTIMGTLSMWDWSAESYTHPGIAAALFQRLCKTKVSESSD